MCRLFEKLFINMCVLFTLIFVYVQIRAKFNIKSKKQIVSLVYDGIAGGILGIVLMYFSIQVADVAKVDLRYLPVMLILIFIGTYPALACAVIIIIGRLSYGINESSIASIVIMILAFLAFVVIKNVTREGTGLYSKSLYMILTYNLIFSIISVFIIGDFQRIHLLFINFWCVSFIGGLVSVWFIDYQRKSNELLKRYQEEAAIDFLTGLNNVRKFNQVWSTLLTNAKQKNERLSLLIIDIDYFKSVNDTYGHPAGDKVLIELGDVLTNSTRSFDVVSRNGGEEFSVILPDCPNHQAVDIAERIRKSVESHLFEISATEIIQITVSIGVATYPINEALVDIADQRLYEAKRLGRNRVCY
ncbi:GGDEF domain-containing protein [Gracilibacillus caseinilyticus]|uniref:GGDEF domain-containing protein n=1 Tax=Gracilibacillus caseinilyticus TaxID=2932256 RepID=A0ABY4F3R4_9BACI|nr:diguanylate cyclase [Gracilibacillus caseinilyticus]UOQ50534.1 GGDEF domain-containing protein [Gracilibacillus caseinilyticus]